MPTVQEIIDPDHTLPSVELKPVHTQEWEGLIREKLAIMADGEQVGECDIVYETHPSDLIAHFDGIEITEAKRGKGIGMASYILAIERAHERQLPFETQDYELTEHSKKIWEVLALAGVARVINPFKPSAIRSGRFVGKYQVPVH